MWGRSASTERSASVVSECDSPVNDVVDSDTSKRADSGCFSGGRGPCSKYPRGNHFRVRRTPLARAPCFLACDDELRWALVVRGFPFGQVYDLRGGSTRLDRLNALMRTFLGLITLAGGDDLADGGFEGEPKLAGLVLADLELG